MTVLNPTGAALRMQALGPIVAGQCLHYVSKVTLNGAPVLQGALTSDESWNDSPHFGGTPPLDFPAHFSFENLGDTAIGLGNGLVVGTHGNKVVVQTIAEREAQLGGKYQGWYDVLSGYTLTVPETSKVVGYFRYPNGLIVTRYADGHEVGFPSLAAYKAAGSPAYTEIGGGVTVEGYYRYPNGLIVTRYSNGTEVGFASLAAYHAAGSPKYTQL